MSQSNTSAAVAARALRSTRSRAARRGLEARLRQAHHRHGRQLAQTHQAGVAEAGQQHCVLPVVRGLERVERGMRRPGIGCFAGDVGGAETRRGAVPLHVGLGAPTCREHEVGDRSRRVRVDDQAAFHGTAGHIWLGSQVTSAGKAISISVNAIMITT
jgi:hypothetical protein